MTHDLKTSSSFPVEASGASTITGEQTGAPALGLTADANRSQRRGNLAAVSKYSRAKRKSSCFMKPHNKELLVLHVGGGSQNGASFCLVFEGNQKEATHFRARCFEKAFSP